MIPSLLAMLVLAVVAGALCGVVALLSLSAFRRTIKELEHKITTLESSIARLRAQERPIGEPTEKEEAVSEALPARPFVGTESPHRDRGPIHDTSPPPLPPAPPTAISIPRDRPGASAPGHLNRPWWTGLEENVGKRWMTWGGALALFLSAGFFLKYAFENQWIGPTGRIALGIMAGAVLLAAGDGCIRRGMRALGQGLMGGGLAILYVAIFAAFSLYGLIAQIPAFAAMVAVTAAGMSLAILHNAIPLGFLAVLGGVLTPLMVSTGQDARDSLFAYLTVLDIGVLGVAFFKRWRALDSLAFLGTWLLFAGWFFSFYRSAALVPTLAWIAVFFLMFVILPFAHQIARRTASSIESFVMALANAVITFFFCYNILHRHYSFALGFVALIMAACYVALAAIVRRRVPEDTRSLFGFVGLSVVLLTLAVPLHLRLHGVTLAWAAEGPILLYLGYVFKYRPVRIAGFLVLLLAGIRLFGFHWPLHKYPYPYVLFLNTSFATAMCLPLAAAAYSAVHQRFSSQSTGVDYYLKTAAWLLGSFAALVVVSGEVWGWIAVRGFEVRGDPQYFSYSAVTMIWALGALGFLLAALGARSMTSFYCGLVALAVGVLLCLASYQVSKHQPYLLIANIRFIPGLILAATMIAYAAVSQEDAELLPQLPAPLWKSLLAAAGLLPLVLVSLEAYTYCWETIRDWRTARWTSYMALSVTWGAYAVAALTIGFWLRLKELRIAALVLLAVVAAKVVLVDMSQVQQIYRIISFVVVGLMMISASYLYHRLEKRLGEAEGGS